MVIGRGADATGKAQEFTHCGRIQSSTQRRTGCVSCRVAPTVRGAVEIILAPHVNRATRQLRLPVAFGSL